MAIFMTTGPAAVMYPLGAVDSTTDDMDMSDTNKVDSSAAAAAAGANAATAAAAAAATSTAPPQHQFLQASASRAAHTSCRRLSSTDARPIFTNPSHKRSRDADDDAFAAQIEPRSSNSNLSATSVNTTFPPLTNDSNAPVIPRCKRVEVDHDADHHSRHAHNNINTNPFNSTTHRTTHMASATVTEPLIARDGWPTESPHFTEERITFALGVGWRYLPVRPGDIGGDLDFVAAMRGWERFIENHFQAHIGRARMFLERKDEGMYLVAATPPGAKTAAQRAQAQRLLTTRYGEAGGGGARCEVKHPAFFDAMEDGDEEVAYYLFKDDLSRARCVGGSWGQCVENLNKRPIRFLEGSVELVAQQPPKTQTQKMGSADGDDMDIDVSN